MSEPYLGEVRIMSFGFPPRGWMRCDGQVLNQSDHQALYDLIGLKYIPQDQQQTGKFALPKLNSRVPIHVGNGHALGESGGVERVTLEFTHVAHSHAAYASTASGDQVAPTNNFLGPGGNLYSSGTAPASGAAPGPAAMVTLRPEAVSQYGGSQAHDNMQPYVALNFCIAVQGAVPPRAGGGSARSAPFPYLGEVRMLAGVINDNDAPGGWMPCDGQVLQISQFGALYSLIGTTYGGDGQTTFRLPDLRDKVPMHANETADNLGLAAGVPDVTLNATEIPQHRHPFTVVKDIGATNVPTGNFLAQSDSLKMFGVADPTVALGAKSVESVGKNLPHTNMQPFLKVVFVIAIDGIFPTRN